MADILREIKEAIQSDDHPSPMNEWLIKIYFEIQDLRETVEALQQANRNRLMSEQKTNAPE